LHERKEQSMRKLALVIGLVVLGAAAFVTYAAAGPPTKQPFDDTSTSTETGICSFPVEVTSSIRGTETDFFDQGGELVRAHLHVNEQDTFSANGKTLTGDPYTFNLFISFENGEVTAVLARGVAEKIRLPDGKLFLSAGVIDFLAQGVSFSIRTDRGRTGDIDALCAALSP
jgi:hypothetical protein